MIKGTREILGHQALLTGLDFCEPQGALGMLDTFGFTQQKRGTRDRVSPQAQHQLDLQRRMRTPEVALKASSDEEPDLKTSRVGIAVTRSSTLLRSAGKRML